MRNQEEIRRELKESKLLREELQGLYRDMGVIEKAGTQGDEMYARLQVSSGHITALEWVLGEAAVTDNVTTPVLDIALRLAGIPLDKELIDHIIDLVELVEKKGDMATMKDIAVLRAQWDEESQILSAY